MPQILKLQALKQGLDDFAHKTAAQRHSKSVNKGLRIFPTLPVMLLGRSLNRPTHTSRARRRSNARVSTRIQKGA
jgi:hypothetical protein